MKTERRVKFGKTLIIFVILLTAFLSVGCASAVTTYTVCPSGCDYTSIQEAIEVADSGDTIEVYSGTYYENVDITKQLILRGVDTGGGKPVVDATGSSSSAITLSADWITLAGFRVLNSGDSGVLVNSNHNTITGNTISNSTCDGIVLWSSYNTITGNTISNSSNSDDFFTYSGITLQCSSDNNTITGNNVCNNNHNGICLFFSCNNNAITGNSACNNSGNGIHISSAGNNDLTDNNISNNGDNGIDLWSSCNNTITGNNVSNNDNGIELWSSCTDNTITGNNLHSNNEYGIDLSYDSNNNTISDNIFVNDGLFVKDSYKNIVENNIVNDKPLVYLEDASNTMVTDAGQVILVHCNNITVKNLDLANTSVGVALLATEDSIITNNNVHSNREGIYLFSSRDNSITGNTLSSNDNGIHIENSSSNNSITGNTFVNDGLFVEDSFKNTVENNTVNGKSLVYLEDASNITVTDSGQVILVNCSNVRVENQDLGNTSLCIELLETEDSVISNNIVHSSRGGIYLGYSSNNSITGNIASNNEAGIMLSYYSNNNTIAANTASGNDGGIALGFFCDNNSVTGNNVSGNDGGIVLALTSNNTITHNTVSDNGGGIVLGLTSNNTITHNTVSNNDNGIYLGLTSDNKIYLNDFMNNSVNVDSTDSSNIWNSTETIAYQYNSSNFTNYLGNFWDDYSGFDANNDGIGDSFYSIDSDNDTYPLMVPWVNYFAPSENQPAITFFSPSSSVSDMEGATRTFDITIDQPVNVSWFINGTEVQKNVSVTSASYTNTSAAVGTWNVSAIATNAKGQDMQVWVWNVTSLPYTHTDAGVTVDIVLTEPSEIEPLLPPGTDISNAVVINVNVTDATPENATDDAYTDITIYVGELDVETCEVYKGGCGFLPEVDDVATLPTVNGSAKFSRDVANNTVIIRLYVGDPLLGVIPSAIEAVFDTGAGTYPSIMGTHNGTIRPNKTIEVQKMYTYPCEGTGGHTEYVAFYNATTGDLIAKGAWKGYLAEDYHYIIFEDQFSIEKDVTYNYTIQTGSYPQVIHEHTANVTGGIITCTEFIDANGKIYYDWIPAIRLE